MAWRQSCRKLLGFATWVGGDMDGNPNVGADTIAASLATQRAQVIEHYLADVAATGAPAQPDRQPRRGRAGAAAAAGRLPRALSASSRDRSARAMPTCLIAACSP